MNATWKPGSNDPSQATTRIVFDNGHVVSVRERFETVLDLMNAAFDTDSRHTPPNAVDTAEEAVNGPAED